VAGDWSPILVAGDQLPVAAQVEPEICANALICGGMKPLRREANGWHRQTPFIADFRLSDIKS